MDSKIILLGTGGDSTVVGKQLRGSGGIILIAEGYQFHIDPGPGALVRCRQFNINPRDNTAVIATHNHLNHAAGLNEVISAMTHNGLDKKGIVISNNTVINGDEGYEPLLNRFYKNCVERFIAVKVGQRVGINSIELRAIKAFHSEPNTFGLKFFTPKFTLSYSSDTRYSPELIEEYRDSSILILNSVYPFGTKDRDLLNLDDCVRIIRDVKPKLSVLTHFGIKMLNADPLYVSREVQKQTGVEVVSAKDGMMINPVNYSAHLTQKTLNLYPTSKDQ